MLNKFHHLHEIVSISAATPNPKGIKSLISMDTICVEWNWTNFQFCGIEIEIIQRKHNIGKHSNAFYSIHVLRQTYNTNNEFSLTFQLSLNKLYVIYLIFNHSKVVIQDLCLLDKQNKLHPRRQKEPVNLNQFS